MSVHFATKHEARACGKVVLFGEYAVLEGGEALVYASKRQVVARCLGLLPLQNDLKRYELTSPTLGSGSWEGILPQTWTLSQRVQTTHGRCEGIHFDFAWATLRALNAPSGSYYVDSDALGIWSEDHPKIWHKLGLGSSAATVSALVQLCAQLNQHSLSSSVCYQLTQQIHYLVQGGLGSGVDVAASAYGGLLRYRWFPYDSLPNTPPQVGWEQVLVHAEQTWIGSAEIKDLTKTLTTDFPALIWIWMGRSASTTSLVTQIHHFRSHEPQRYQDLMAQIIQAESLAVSALHESAQDRQRAFCEAIAEGGRATQALTQYSHVPIWTPEHSTLQALIQPLGASLKPTGAGGGDLALACAPDEEAHQALLNLCTQAGWRLVQI